MNAKNSGKIDAVREMLSISSKDRALNRVLENTRVGFNRAILSSIDMRGKTKSHVVTYHIWGGVHYLDAKSLAVATKFVNDFGKPTEYLKHCLENGIDINKTDLTISNMNHRWGIQL